MTALAEFMSWSDVAKLAVLIVVLFACLAFMRDL